MRFAVHYIDALLTSTLASERLTFNPILTCSKFPPAPSVINNFDRVTKVVFLT